MHELGVVFYVIRDAKKTAEENQLSKITAVTLEIGEVSGVIPEQLRDCWNWAIKREPMMDECQLKIEILPAVTYCEDCGEEYETVTFGKICPYCGSEHTYLKCGNEFTLKEIEVPEDDEDSGTEAEYLPGE